MSEKTYRIGLVGCGGMGRHHLNCIESVPDCECVALCDVLEENLKKTGEQFGIDSHFTDFDQMYQEAELDLVVVATQTRDHHGPTVAAAKHGVHILCEKPISIDPAEADEMVAATRKAGVKFSIHQQNHVNAYTIKAQQLIAEGLIGDVLLVRGRNKAGRKSGNEFMEMGTHITDMMMCAAGPPAWVSGTVFVENRLAEIGDIMEAKEMSPRDRDSGLVMGHRVLAQYGFVNGASGEVHFLPFTTRNNRNYGFDVIGTEGQLAVRATEFGEADPILWHLDRAMEGYPSDLDWKPIKAEGVTIENPVVTMYKKMFEAIEADSEPPSSGASGMFALEMILGIYESHRQNGGRISLPMTERSHPLERWRAEEG